MENGQEFYQDHKNIKDYRKEYYQKNKEKWKVYRLKNKDKDKDKDKNNEYMRNYREKNKEEIREYQREYQRSYYHTKKKSKGSNKQMFGFTKKFNELRTEIKKLDSKVENYREYTVDVVSKLNKTVKDTDLEERLRKLEVEVYKKNVR